MRRIYNKCYELEVDIGGGDTRSEFIFADSAEEVVEALADNDYDVTVDDLSEVDPNGKYYRAWAHTYGKMRNVDYVKNGEFVDDGEPPYDRMRDLLYDLALEQMEAM